MPPTSDLPDSIRIPLHSLQADTEYLLARIEQDPAIRPHIAISILERLSQIETACLELVNKDSAP